MGFIVMNKRLYYTVFLYLLTLNSSAWCDEDCVPLPPPPLPPLPLWEENFVNSKAPTLSCFGFRGSPNWRIVEIVHPVKLTILHWVISECSQTVSIEMYMYLLLVVFVFGVFPF